MAESDVFLRYLSKRVAGVSALIFDAILSDSRDLAAGTKTVEGVTQYHVNTSHIAINGTYPIVLYDTAGSIAGITTEVMWSNEGYSKFVIEFL
jgi:hypothetical protein